MDPVHEYTDWIEHWELAVTDDSADEYIATQRTAGKKLTDADEAAVRKYAEDFGEVNQ